MAKKPLFAMLQIVTTRYISLLKWLHIIPSTKYFRTTFHLIDLYHSHLSTRIILALFIANMLYKTGHIICFFLLEKIIFTSEKVNLINFNYTALQGLPSYLNFFCALDFLIVLLFYRAIFYDNNGYSDFVLKQVLVEGSSKFFFEPHWKINAKANDMLRKSFNYDFNEVPMERNLQNIGLLVKTTANVIILFLNLYFLFHHFKNSQRLYYVFNCTNMEMLLAQLNFASVFICIYFIFSLMVFATVLLVLIFTIVFLKFSQMKTFLRRLNSRSFNSRTFTTFNRAMRQMIIWNTDCNRIYGSLTFFFILSNIPSNAFLLVMFFTVRPITAFVVVVFLVQTFFLLFVQVIGAKIGQLFADPAKPILSLTVSSAQIWTVWNFWTLSTRLKLTFYIEQFHNANQYTANYGKYGKITFGTSSKNLIYYLKFLIFGLKLFYNQ